MMRALTLIQPWATAIARWGKDIENRSWTPPRWLLGQRIAIHAGRTVDLMGFMLFVDSRGIDRSEMQCGDLPRGAVVATARLAGFVQPGDGSPGSSTWSSSGDDAKLVPAAFKSPWLSGDFGWVLADVRELPEPVPCRGYQRLWSLAADVEKRVREQERDPRAEDRAEEGGMR